MVYSMNIIIVPDAINICAGICSPGEAKLASYGRLDIETLVVPAPWSRGDIWYLACPVFKSLFSLPYALVSCIYLFVLSGWTTIN